MQLKLPFLHQHVLDLLQMKNDFKYSICYIVKLVHNEQLGTWHLC
jgi:hypothetical protein